MRSIAACSAVLAFFLFGGYFHAFAPAASWSAAALVYCFLAFLSFFLVVFTPLYLLAGLRPGRRWELAAWAAIPAALILCAGADAACYRLFKAHLDRFIVSNTVYALWTREIDPFDVRISTAVGGVLGLVLLISAAAAAAAATESLRRHARRTRAADAALMAAWLLFLYQGAALNALKTSGFHAWGIFPFEKTNLAAFRTPPGSGPAFTAETEFERFRTLKLPPGLRAKRRPNIVLVHAESLRGDAFTPENMPLLSARAALCEKTGRCRVLRGHYSTSNNTASGVFGILSGLNGFFYFPAKRTGAAPLPLDALKELGWRSSLYSTSDMGYDGIRQFLFDKTFARIYPPIKEHSRNGPMEKFDRKMLETYLDDLSKTDFKAGPRLDYVVTYLPHYNYYYTPRCAKHAPVLELPFEFSSGSFSRMDEHFAQLRNRYLNAACETDFFLDEIIRKLQALGQWDDTILVFFGDHGEEFGEKGRIGHSLGQNDEQVRTAFAAFFPTPVPKIRYSVTSHADVMPTLFHYMGVPGGASFMNGKDLFSYDPARDFAVVADGGFRRQMRYRYSIVSPELKVTFPNYGPLDPDRTAVFDRSDAEMRPFDRDKTAELLRKALESKTAFTK